MAILPSLVILAERRALIHRVIPERGREVSVIVVRDQFIMERADLANCSGLIIV